MNEIVLSIVIPVYNSGKYLEETLQSIGNVGFSFPYEVILVNDGSTDLVTLEILEKNKNKYIIYNKENGGASSARNHGIERARGKYILPFDSDDVMCQSNYNNALEFLISHKNIDVIYGNRYIFGNGNKIYQKSLGFNRMALVISRPFPPTPSIFKRKVWEEIGGYNTSFRMTEDWDFWSRSALKQHEYYHYPKPLYMYRRMEDGKSLSQQNIAEHYENRQKIINNVPREYFTQKNINEYVLTSFKNEKKLFIKAGLMVFFPGIYKFLRKKNIFKNDMLVC